MLDLVLGDHIQADGRFVQEQDIGAVQQRTSQSIFMRSPNDSSRTG